MRVTPNAGGTFTDMTMQYEQSGELHIHKVEIRGVRAQTSEIPS
jgi:N-methylhydantoinase A/oxoprolinase/acetone carboxylase beta subunit